MSAPDSDYVIFRLTNIVFLCSKQFKISNNSINDYSTDIKSKTCSAPTEPSYTMRPETKNNPGLKRISAVTQLIHLLNIFQIPTFKLFDNLLCYMKNKVIFY